MLQTKIKDNELAQQMLHLVVPIAIQQFMLALVSATDALMLGFVDQASLSAVSLAGQIQFVLNLFIAGIAAGCGIIIAQYWGKKDTTSIEKVMPVALYTNLIFGWTFTDTGFVYSKPPHADLYQRCNPDCQRHLLFKSRCIFLCPLWHFADLFDPFKKYRACGA